MEDLSIDSLNLDGSTSTIAKKEKKLPFYDIAFSSIVAFDIEAIARLSGLRGEIVQEKGKQDVEMGVEEIPVVKAAPAKGWGFGLFGRK